MPMNKKSLSLTPSRVWIILGLIWLASNLCDRIWLMLDHSMPAWDQSNHLNKSLQYVYELESPQFLNGEWWRNFWKLSSKYPPLTYIIAAIFQKIFGVGNDQALLTNLLYSAILILSVYTLGKILFSPQVGLWGATLSILIPRLYQTRLQFVIDNTLLTLTIACFCCLTLWKIQKYKEKQWLWTVIFGLVWGLALLTKQSVMFFLLTPLLWLGLTYLWQGKWERILQLITSFIVSSLIWFPWYRTNWIYLFSTVQNSNAIPASYEGDPPLNTLAAWTYYWQDLPLAMGWILLIVPLVGLLLHLLRRFPGINEDVDSKKAISGIKWLGVYFLGSYLICSAIFNKDTRYIMSYLPILAIFLGYCLTLWRGKYKPVRWVTLGVAIWVMVTNLFPISFNDNLTLSLSPGVLFRPYMGPEIPNTELMETVRKTTPYQLANLGVIANTDSINHNTLNYYGQLANFQIYGRELGNKAEDIQQDQQYFDWFVTKTGDNGFARDTQLALAKKLENDPNFKVIKAWELPDKSTLKLYQRKTPSVRVESLSKPIDQIKLDQVIIPQKAIPGLPVAVTYEWSGNLSELNSGIVLLDWQLMGDKTKTNFWIHDHGFGQGMLYHKSGDDKGVKLIETMSMIPPKNMLPGQYELKATYLNRQTQKTYPINIPKITLTLDPNAYPIVAPPLDLNSQLRGLSLNLGQGIDGLGKIFDEIDRINQYDPIQDYLKQTQEALTYRLTHQSTQYQLDWTYGVVLSYILQENPQGAIAALKELIKLDPNNPYHHGYLGFVYLYDWQPKAAEIAIKSALKLKSNIKEFQYLDGISAIMQGNFIKGWRVLSPLL
ncbi:phospholipid carrier-dependent glycosyltransferase [Aphanothece sacrum]|uniref:Glycosyl transferase n=1 Tax=Aphanothece sacrum FPU1 TaxID=1920663 RepID=A0A401INT4_APHSA|nr:phospholipid carrier-dependent glycosyltransferase [Aphanothece sacrum]GBF82909.1 glycosyl transferase [Aphanothece sacrum FPU1]GBF86512.1 hypothetical protein AsFPU3_3583 [Aphanothece sacrum FPU3]